MNKDNDAIINDILNEIENKSKPKIDDFIEQNEKNTYQSKPVRSHEKSALSQMYDNSAKTNSNESNDNSRTIIARTPEIVNTNQQDSVINDNSRIAITPEITDSIKKDDNTSSNFQNETMIRKNPQVSKTQSNQPKKKKKKRKKYRLPGVLVLTTFIFAVSISLSLVIIAYGKDMLGIGKNNDTQLIIIPEGASTAEISLILEENNIIRSPEFFQIFARLSESEASFVAGEHFVRANMAYETIIQELTSIASDTKEEVEVMFPEGVTIVEAANKLEEAGVCSASDFIFYFNSGGYGFDFEDRVNYTSLLKFYRMEGYLFPDTYFLYIDMDPEQVCQKIYMNFDNKMTEDRLARMEELNLTLDQLVTFASIVQAEAPTKDSMIMVASVFWNRLNNSDDFPRLQSDPTTKYADNVIRPNMEIFNQAMIDAYDTYTGTGLPPGAIGNPGIEAIDAVLTAFESDYFYFYANIYTQQTYFATTLEEHEANEEMIKQQIADAQALENGE